MHTLTLPREANPASSPSSSLRTLAHALRITSDELLKGAREIVIEHRGEEYRLLRTRNDRLILNK